MRPATEPLLLSSIRTTVSMFRLTGIQSAYDLQAGFCSTVKFCADHSYIGFVGLRQRQNFVDRGDSRHFKLRIAV